jgi:hydroxymethylbilane synthase
LGAGEELHALVRAIDHGATHAAVTSERAFLAAVGGDCHSALAALAGDGLLRAEILRPDGSEVLSGEGEPAELAQRLLSQASPALRAMFGR